MQVSLLIFVHRSYSSDEQDKAEVSYDTSRPNVTLNLQVQFCAYLTKMDFHSQDDFFFWNLRNAYVFKQDIQGLITWVLGEGVEPSWICVKVG